MIETSLLNDLRKRWNLYHCYTREPEGIRAMLALFAVTRNSLVLFAYRRLRTYDPAKVRLRNPIRLVVAGWACYGCSERLRRDRYYSNCTMIACFRPRGRCSMGDRGPMPQTDL